jgi:hypothetical protein
LVYSSVVSSPSSSFFSFFFFFSCGFFFVATFVNNVLTFFSFLPTWSDVSIGSSLRDFLDYSYSYFFNHLLNSSTFSSKSFISWSVIQGFFSWSYPMSFYISSINLFATSIVCYLFTCSFFLLSNALCYLLKFLNLSSYTL